MHRSSQTFAPLDCDPFFCGCVKPGAGTTSSERRKTANRSTVAANMSVTVTSVIDDVALISLAQVVQSFCFRTTTTWIGRRARGEKTCSNALPFVVRKFGERKSSLVDRQSTPQSSKTTHLCERTEEFPYCL